MSPDAMIPHGLALLAYYRGETSAQVTIRRDDGIEDPLPVSRFFRSPDEFNPIEVAAIERCRGHVLDVGAGTGIHSLVLQSRGPSVTAIDISPQAVEILTERGVADARCVDVFDFEEGPFDTLLMLGRGIGMVEDIPGLARFLVHAHRLTGAHGQILLDSVDVSGTDNPDHMAYHESNRRAGRYIGEVRLQFEYRGQVGPYCGWLHIDPHTLRERAGHAGWECEIILEEESGEYLARLTHLRAARPLSRTNRAAEIGSQHEDEKKMNTEVYERLAQALDRLPNGFPRTPSNVEIKLLQKIFTEEEAGLVGQLTGTMEPAEDIARRVALPVDEAGARLKELAQRGLLWFDKESSEVKFRLAPFVVGFYEAQLRSMDRELAQLVDDYLADGGAAGIMKYDPALHRVIPVRGAATGDWVLPYDDVKKILLKARSYANHDCICRVQKAHLGQKCDFPVRNCLVFNLRTEPPGFDTISQAQALAILDEAENVGLVHCVSNITDGLGYICNCCGCCCAVLRGITEWGVDKSVAHANYYAVVDADKCTDCQTCHDRCQVNAIETSDDVSVVVREKCIGCGLCVSGCPEEAIELKLKPETEIVHPPKDFPTWEKMRLESRGLA